MQRIMTITCIIALAAFSWGMASVSSWAQESEGLTDGARSTGRASGTHATEAQQEEGSTEREKPPFMFPKISGHGQVVQLPHAVDQPRAGSKICVDVTAGGSPDELNGALDKVARFVNIYAGAGARPADVSITVILHGKATLTSLNHDAYARKFSTKENPNLPLLAKLKEAGVELLVCGQAVAHAGVRYEDIAEDVGVAVSALTVNVNRQADGFAFIPLH